ncbi:HHL172Wp [Eremothecium sinecaudum]|uniref:HHL172Wp n=1 Tax=Eremothecium sinecaudum TaxID=45286 RepID=A0A0X8HWB1_9SACH|nr:HHL172Wp [Eremothecium sinecaudum]AMD22598.1 HHL172Wp [Eremothecium sinecaudum]
MSESPLPLSQIRCIDVVRVLYDFTPTSKHELPLKLGDVVYVLSKLESGWCDGVIVDHPNKVTQCQRGWFPQEYVRSSREKRYPYYLNAGWTSGTNINNLYSRANSLAYEGSAPNLRSESMNARQHGGNFARVPSLTSNEAGESNYSYSASPDAHMKQDYRLEMRHRVLHGYPVKAVGMSRVGTDEILMVDPLQKLTLEDEHTLRDNKSNASAPQNLDKKQFISPSEAAILYGTAPSGGSRQLPTEKDGSETFTNDKEQSSNSRATSSTLPNPEMVFRSVFPQEERNAELTAKDLGLSKVSSSISPIENCSTEAPQSIWTKTLACNQLSGKNSLRSRNNTDILRPKGDSKREALAPDSYSGQPFFTNDDLFLHHPTDMRTWTELCDSALYHIKLSYENIIRNNQPQFNIHINRTSKRVTTYIIACRLLRDKLLESDRFKETMKIMKRIILSLGGISVHASFYFNSGPCFQCTPHADDKHSMADDNGFSKIPHSHVSSQTTGVIASVTSDRSSNIPGSSAADAEILPQACESPTAESEALDRVHALPHGDRGGYGYHSKADIRQSFTSKAIGRDSDDSNPYVDDAQRLLDNILHRLDTEYAILKDSIAKLTVLMKSDNPLRDSLPQTYPRLFKNSFDSCGWTNPFNQLGYGQKGSQVALQHCSNSEGPTVTSNAEHNVSVAQGSNTSSKASGFFINRNGSKTFSRSKSVKNVTYPLTEDTFKLFKSKLTQLAGKRENDLRVLNLPKSTKRNLEVAACTYDTIALLSSMIDIMEAIDLTFFVNLRDLPYVEPSANLDKESMDLRDHCVTTATALLLEFFDVKQAAHDITIGIIMDTQNLTLRDPYVFASMRGDLTNDGDRDRKKYQFVRLQKLSNALCDHLTKQDVEFNDEKFLDTDAIMVATLGKLMNIMDTAAQIIEQLVNERKQTLHYAVMMMKNDLIAELVKGEQEKWFDTDDNTCSKLNSTQEVSSPNNAQLGRDTSLPWYLENQYDYLLVYDANGNIKGGTKESLIEYLTSHLTVDVSFTITMLVTFRSMFTTAELLKLLIARYNLYPPDGLSYDAYSVWVTKKHIPIKTRVISILNLWLSCFWVPSYYTPSLSELLSFAKMAKDDHVAGADELIDLVKEVIEQKDSFHGFTPRRIHFSTIQKDSIVKGVRTFPSVSSLDPPLTATSSATSLANAFRLKKLRLLDIDPSIFAKQLTIKEHELYCKIVLFECLARAWRTRYCDFGSSTNISNFIKNSNHLTNFVSYIIVKQNDLKQRSQVIQYFITVAEQCHHLNNFSSMTAIVSAMYSSSVYRLKRTWGIVPNNYKDILEKLNALMDSTKNFSRYRELLESVREFPCVPFFGVYLSDLTFTAGGNPDNLDGTSDIINFGKRSRIVSVLKEIDSYQCTEYNLERHSDVLNFLDEHLTGIPNIEKQYEQSLRIEPRSEVSAGLNTSSYHQKHFSTSLKGRKLRFVARRKKTQGASP